MDIFLSKLKNNTELHQREISESFIDCLKEIAKKPDNPRTIEDKI
jgi:hypothetical protein